MGEYSAAPNRQSFVKYSTLYYVSDSCQNK